MVQCSASDSFHAIERFKGRTYRNVAFIQSDGVHWVVFIHDLSTKEVTTYESMHIHYPWNIREQRAVVLLLTSRPCVCPFLVSRYFQLPICRL